MKPFLDLGQLILKWFLFQMLDNDEELFDETNFIVNPGQNVFYATVSKQSYKLKTVLLF